jgi:hypothetical protein
VTVTGCEWIPKQVRTGGVSGPVHQEWRLEVAFNCDAEPLRMAAMLVNWEAGALHHVRPSPAAEHEATYRINFFPYDWSSAEDVQINAMGSRIAVHCPELTREPNVFARPLVEVGQTTATGAILDLVDLAATGWVAQVALFAKSDTKKDRTRWRLQCPGDEEQGSYDFLWSGRRSGTVQLHDR